LEANPTSNLKVGALQSLRDVCGRTDMPNLSEIAQFADELLII